MEVKTVLITGATEGIGRQVAREMAEKGHRVILHGRRAGKLKEVADEIASETGNSKIHFFVADLASLDEVRNLAGRIVGEHQSLQVLVNNAGVFMKERKLSRDGYEMTFAVNHLAHFLLTISLMPLIKKSVPARIVTVSSVSHWPGVIEWDNLQSEKRYSAHQTYSLSKLANILFTFELARRLEGTGITATTLDPGNIDTKMLRVGWPSIAGASVKEGARTPIWLATSDEAEGISGVYFEDCKPSDTSPLSQDRKMQRKLWDVSAALVGVSPEEW